jgi:hypothetical protein
MTPFSSRRYRLLPITLLTALIVTSGIPWLYPAREAVPEAPDLYTVARSEVPPYFIGTTTLGEFLPRWVEELPDTEPLRDELIATGNPDRLQPAGGLTWTRHTTNPLDARYTIEANRPLTVTYRHFYFPGWQATLDGRRVDVTPSQRHGLITLPVPAGRHELRIFLGTTGARQAGWAITGLGAILWLTLAWRAGVRRRDRQREGSRSAVTPPHLLLLGGAAVSLWLFFTLVDTPLRRPTLLPNGILGKPTITPLDYAGELRLLSYERSATEIRADEAIQLTLYWQPQHEISVDYDVGVQVTDEQGWVWNDRRTNRPFDWRFVAGDEPWPLDSYRMDPFLLRLLDGTPPGDYQFHVGLVRRQTGQTVAAHDLEGFRVTAPMQGERPLEEGMQKASETAVSNNLRLLGSRLDRTEAVPGDPVRVDVLWQVGEGTAVSDNQFRLQLSGPNGDPVIQQQLTIAPGSPVSHWSARHPLRSLTAPRPPASTSGAEHLRQASWGDQ